jgi:kynureninase
MGHAAPFAFDPAYAPADGVARYLCGTPPILSMAALECGIASLASLDGVSDPMPALREKSIALTELFIALVEARCAESLRLASPRTAAWRGSQVGFHPCGVLEGRGYPLMRALTECGVTGDFRKGATDAGDILRFGFAPAYLRHVDVFDAAEALADAIASEAYRDPRFQVRAAVT